MDQVVELLRSRFPALSFVEGDSFYWSPETKEVFYGAIEEKTGIWSLLHETSHALLGHKNYQTDLELLRLEMAAWEHAKKLAQEFSLIIDDDHIQDCLDTYRDWLHARSTCPACTNQGLQQANFRYRCHNCHTVWRVTASRFCRSYRTREA